MSEIFEWILVATVIVTIMIYLVYSLYKKVHVRVHGTTIDQASLQKAFANTQGDTLNDYARNVIEAAQDMNPEEIRAIDHLAIATTFLVNANDKEKAYQHLRAALSATTAMPDKHTMYIADRVVDFRDYFMDMQGVHEELDAQNAYQAYMMHVRWEDVPYPKKQPMPVGKPKVEQQLNPSDEGYAQQQLLSKQNWHVDPQNVHDSALYSQLSRQFQLVRGENENIDGNDLHTYEEAKRYIQSAVTDKNRAAVNTVLNTLDKNEPSSITGVNERDILMEVWRRSFDPRNAENADKIRDSMCDTLSSCVDSNGNIVCGSGRTKNIWSALARVDADEDVGIFKSKEILRNEIYEKSARIVDMHVGEAAPISAEVRADYTNGNETEQVRELRQSMLTAIESIATDYTADLPVEQVQQAIEECKAVV